jgi:fructuronate reductase
MIDRIAVAPDENTQKVMAQLGIRSNMVVTENVRYWAVEDIFPAGRPKFEKAAGVFMEDSYQAVKKYEDMKLRILNMSHSLIAGLGVLLGYRGRYSICSAMQDKEITTLINRIIAVVIQTVDHPKKLDPQDFAKATLERLNNPNIPDDPMRIAFCASAKMLPRFMDTYYAGQNKGLPETELNLVLLPVAGFIRYTLAIDDQGQTYGLEDDPLKDLLVSCGAKAKLGEPDSVAAFQPIIAHRDIMGQDLYGHGNTGKILEAMVAKMLEGPGSVRKILQDYLK